MKKLILLVNVFYWAATVVVAAPVSNTQLERRVSRATEAAVRQANNNLLDAVNNPQVPAARLRTFFNQGADPCRALPFAVFANNAAAVRVLAEYKDRCNWKYAVEQRLQLVMQKDFVDVFYALMADNRGITCPDPFAFTPAQPGAQWHPVSAQMLAAVNQRCFQTRHTQANFLKDVILLNPGQRTIFGLGENYHFGIHSAQTQKQWLDSVEQLVKSRVEVSSDTLQDVISRSRSTAAGTNYNLPFNATRRLVKLCLQGGANGQAVLRQLDSPVGEWAWKNYSAEERMRLSNILENKPETQSRTMADRLRHAYHRIF